jgi:hypothetical protein
VLHITSPFIYTLYLSIANYHIPSGNMSFAYPLYIECVADPLMVCNTTLKHTKDCHYGRLQSNGAGTNRSEGDWDHKRKDDNSRRQDNQNKFRHPENGKILRGLY